MIKFFRHIRQKLLAENQFRKYLLYAIGEIILVVIGILIALQINNWNQQKKDDKAGRHLLERLHRDLVQDTLYFRTTLRANKELREEMKEALVTLYDGVADQNEVDALSTTYDKALDQVFAPNDNTYNSIISAGTLGLIANKELQEAILDHYGSYEQIGSILLSINEWMIGIATEVDIQTDFLKYNRMISDIYTQEAMLTEQGYAFLNDPNNPKFQLLVRALSATAFNQNVRNLYYEELIQKCDTLLRQIDAELGIAQQ